MSPKSVKKVSKKPEASPEIDGKGFKTKVRIKIRSYDNRIIDNSAKQIVDAALRNGSDVIGPIPLPTEFRKYTVNRSTFVHKDSREQYELRVHKRLVDIVNINPKTTDALTNLSLPAGVEIELKML